MHNLTFFATTFQHKKYIDITRKVQKNVRDSWIVHMHATRTMGMKC